MIAFARPSGLLGASDELSMAAASGLPIVVVACTEARGGDDVASLAREAGAALYVADSEESFRRAFYEALSSHSTAVVDARVTR